MNSYVVDIEYVLNSLKDIWSTRNSQNLTAFSKIKRRGKNIMMCCPFHAESKPSFGISTDYPYVYNCFSCGTSGELTSLVAHVYRCSYMEARNILKSEYSLINTNFDTNNDDKFIYPTEEEVLKFRCKRHDYIEKRGISERTIQKYEIGFDEDNFSITFPVRDLNNELSFILRRSVNSKFYNFPKNAPKEVLYGLNYLFSSDKEIEHCFIVEGTMDVLSCYEKGLPSVGLMGRSISDKQIKQLQKAGIRSVTLFLDNDKWGVFGNLDLYKKIAAVTSIKISVASYPGNKWGIDTVNEEEVSYKDPNDLLLGRKLNRELKKVSFLNYYLTLRLSKYAKEVISCRRL